MVLLNGQGSLVPDSDPYTGLPTGGATLSYRLPLWYQPFESFGDPQTRTDYCQELSVVLPTIKDFSTAQNQLLLERACTAAEKNITPSQNYAPQEGFALFMVIAKVADHLPRERADNLFDTLLSHAIEGDAHAQLAAQAVAAMTRSLPSKKEQAEDAACRTMGALLRGEHKRKNGRYLIQALNKA